MVRPSRLPKASRSVRRSDSAWHGWWPTVSMLMTGTPACSARSDTVSSAPVRIPIAATWRERTYAVSRIHSQRVAECAELICGWEWDVALLQEVPPWWPEPLAARAGADARRVLTSRNSVLPLRRAVAVRWPDVIKSNGGGCNVILVRDTGIVE